MSIKDFKATYKEEIAESKKVSRPQNKRFSNQLKGDAIQLVSSNIVAIDKMATAIQLNEATLRRWIRDGGMKVQGKKRGRKPNVLNVPNVPNVPNAKTVTKTPLPVGAVVSSSSQADQVVHELNHQLPLRNVVSVPHNIPRAVSKATPSFVPFVVNFGSGISISCPSKESALDLVLDAQRRLS